MKLTRDKIQRMMGDRRGSTTSGTGAGGGGIIGNGVTPEYYNQNFELLYKQTVTSSGTTTTTYLTALPNEVVAVGTVTDETTGDVTVTSLIGPVAKNALVIGNGMLVYDSQNNAIKVVNRDGVTPASFYATGSVSALGYAAGGGGGGATALTDLVDTAISSPTNGQVLMYNSTTGKWYNGTVQQGSSAWSDITGKPTTIAGYGITDAKIQNGTITLGSNSITPLTSYTETDPTVPAWAKAASKPSYSFSELTSHPTTIAGYGITDAKIQNGTITLGSNTITPLTSVAFSDLTSHPSTLSGYGITDAKFGTAVADYVPITLGSTTKNVLISHQSLSGYLSTSGGTMTNTNLVTNMNADLLDGMHVVTPGTPTVSGVYAQRIPFIGSNYVMEVGRYLDFHTADGTGDFTTRLYLHENSNNTVDANGNSVMLPSGTGVLALTSDNVASATKLQNARTIWGQSFDGTGNVTGSLTDVTDITASGTITSTNITVNLDFVFGRDPGYIWYFGVGAGTGGTSNLSFNLFRNNRSYTDQAFAFRLNPIVTNGSTTGFNLGLSGAEPDATLALPNNGKLRIGGGVLKWDSTNNALYVEKSDGTSASFYATGSVSALGFSAGTSAVDAMTFGYLTVNNRLTFNGPSGAYTHTIYDNSEGGLNINAYNILNIGSNVMMSNKRLYLSSSSYIYVSGSTLYFSNGTTTRTIATL